MDNATAAERFRTTLALFEAGVAMMRQNLRREFPEADEKEIDSKLVAWLQHRPGAEYGDCVGRPVDPAVRFLELAATAKAQGIWRVGRSGTELIPKTRCQ